MFLTTVICILKAELVKSYLRALLKVNVTSYSNAASNLRARCDVTNSQCTKRALWYVNIGSDLFTNEWNGHVEVRIKYDL